MMHNKVPKQIALSLILLSCSFLRAMNGLALPLTTDQVNSKVADLWKDRNLTIDQKLAKLRIYLHHAERQVVGKFFSEVMNPKVKSVKTPLDDALNAYENVPLFKTLLAFNASTTTQIGTGTNLFDRIQRKPAFKKAIAEQKVIDQVSPILTDALLGEDEEVAAQALKALINKGVINEKEQFITEQELFDLLKTFALQKKADMEKIENVTRALDAILHDKVYTKNTPDDNTPEPVKVTSSYGLKHILGAVLLGAGLTAGAGYLWENLDHLKLESPVSSWMSPQ